MNRVFATYPGATAELFDGIQDLQHEPGREWWFRRGIDGVEWEVRGVHIHKLWRVHPVELAEHQGETDWYSRIELAKLQGYQKLIAARDHGAGIYHAWALRKPDVDRLVIDWLNALPEIEPSLLPKLWKVTWAQAVLNSKAWHEQLVKKKLIGVAGDKGTVHVCDSADGWKWVKLTTHDALDREGKVMGHCVGNGGYDHFAGKKGVEGIYSLRDSDGRSCVTIEVEVSVGRFVGRYTHIEQVQGPGNSTPAADLVRHFGPLDLALALGGESRRPLWPSEYQRDLRDGMIYNIDDLPTGVVLERLDTYIQSLHKLPSAISVNGDMFVRPNYFFAPAPGKARLPAGLIVRGNLRCQEELLPLPDDVVVCGKVLAIEKLGKVVGDAVNGLTGRLQAFLRMDTQALHVDVEDIELEHDRSRVRRIDAVQTHATLNMTMRYMSPEFQAHLDRYRSRRSPITPFMYEEVDQFIEEEDRARREQMQRLLPNRSSIHLHSGSGAITNNAPQPDDRGLQNMFLGQPFVPEEPAQARVKHRQAESRPEPHWVARNQNHRRQPSRRRA